MSIKVVGITSLLMRPTSVGKDTQHELGQPLNK
ncbi:hypothetical protein VIAE109791_18100 [Vibrio aestuarianus subsp. francensis]